MMSITKILILFTATIAISEEALGVNVDTDRPSALVSDRNEMLDTLSYTKLIVSNHDELDFTWPVRTRFYNMQLSSSNDDTISTKKPIVNKHGKRREQRQVLVKTKDSSLRSMLRNRRRRSSSNLDTSTNKNTTLVVSPTLINSETPKFSENKRLLIMLLTSFTSISPPYLVFPPINWEEVDNIFT